MNKKKFDVISNLHDFISMRSDTIIKKEYKKIRSLQTINLLIKCYYEDEIPNVYFSRSGCEIENFPDFQEEYSKHDSVRLLGSLITHNFNEAIVSLCLGNYFSTIVFLRSIFEWEIKTLAIITDLSLLTGKKEHKNKISCFDGLRSLEKSYQATRSKELRNKIKLEKNKIKVDERFSEEDKSFLLLLLSERKSFSHIIRNLNTDLLKYIDIGKYTRYNEFLLCLYSELSEYTHISIDELDKISIGGARYFYNKQEFNYFFSKVSIILDIILYLYLVIFDLEVHNSTDEYRFERRKKLKWIFDKTANEITFLKSTKKLLNSKKWISEKGSTFI